MFVAYICTPQHFCIVEYEIVIIIGIYALIVIKSDIHVCYSISYFISKSQYFLLRLNK